MLRLPMKLGQPQGLRSLALKTTFPITIKDDVRSFFFAGGVPSYLHASSLQTANLLQVYPGFFNQYYSNVILRTCIYNYCRWTFAWRRFILVLAIGSVNVWSSSPLSPSPFRHGAFLKVAVYTKSEKIRVQVAQVLFFTRQTIHFPTWSCPIRCYGLRHSLGDLGKFSIRCLLGNVLPRPFPVHTHRYVSKSIVVMAAPTFDSLKTSVTHPDHEESTVALLLAFEHSHSE